MSSQLTNVNQQEWYTAFWQLFIYVSIGAAIVGLWLLWRVVRAQNRLNQAMLLTHLNSVYSTSEMYDAIQTVLDWKEQEFDKDPSKQKHRRTVLHFLEFLGTLVRFGVIKEELLRDRFRDQVSIWEKILPIHTRVQEKIIRERRPNLSDGEITALAIRDVETSSAHWLYLRWKDSRRPTWRSGDD